MMMTTKTDDDDDDDDDYEAYEINPYLVMACETKLSIGQTTYCFLPPNYVGYRKYWTEHGGSVMLADNEDFTLSQSTYN